MSKGKQVAIGIVAGIILSVISLFIVKAYTGEEFKCLLIPSKDGNFVESFYDSIVFLLKALPLIVIPLYVIKIANTEDKDE